jgi:hypothetical protein
LKVDQISPTKKMSMVPRPTAERVGRRNSVEEELSFSPKKFNRFENFSFLKINYLTNFVKLVIFAY